MRLAISGTGCQGKSTLIKDFLKEWPMYKTESQTYRDVLTSEKLPHSKHATKDTQWKILNHMIDEMQTFEPGDNIIMDRCPIDNLVYSLWCFEKGVGDIDKEFIDKCIPLVCESLRSLDIIFFTPITKAAPITPVEDGVREADPVYIKEIDNIFKMIGAQHIENNGRNPFFPKEDAPGWIEVFGDRPVRIAMIKQYIDETGDLVGGWEVEPEPDIVDPTNQSVDEGVNAMKALIEDQQNSKKFEADLADQKQLIKDTLGEKEIDEINSLYNPRD